MTLLFVPDVATATNSLSSGLQTTLLHELSAADVLVVHVIPSGDVITRFPIPDHATATKIDNSELHATPRH